MTTRDILMGIKALLHERLPEVRGLRRGRTLKADDSYVTKGDLLCEKLVMDYARLLPGDFEVISEEMDLSHFAYDPAKNYIVLDPIDGTENFTSGLKEWGVSVSIYTHGIHTRSMLALPELDLWLMTGDVFTRHQSRIYGLSSSLTKKHLLELEDGHEYRIMGCCVFNMYNVVSGSYATFENSKGANTWDILAGLNLALEHGLTVEVEGEEYKGEFLPPGKKYRFKIVQAVASRSRFL